MRNWVLGHLRWACLLDGAKLLAVICLSGFVLALAAAGLLFHRAWTARVALRTAHEEIPLRLAAAFRTLLESIQLDDSYDYALRTIRVDVEDVNGDGRKELLYQHPTGAHGTTLKVFGWKGFDLSKLAELGADTPVGFEIGDYDGDGRIEIKTEGTDWSVGQPYVTAPRWILLYRWNGSTFDEVSRQRISS